MDRDIELKRRIDRVNYLVRRAQALIKINPEQVEAYVQRINWHKQKILSLLEEK